MHGRDYEKPRRQKYEKTTNKEIKKPIIDKRFVVSCNCCFRYHNKVLSINYIGHGIKVRFCSKKCFEYYLSDLL